MSSIVFKHSKISIVECSTEDNDWFVSGEVVFGVKRFGMVIINTLIIILQQGDQSPLNNCSLTATLFAHSFIPLQRFLVEKHHLLIAAPIQYTWMMDLESSPCWMMNGRSLRWRLCKWATTWWTLFLKFIQNMPFKIINYWCQFCSSVRSLV